MVFLVLANDGVEESSIGKVEAGCRKPTGDFNVDVETGMVREPGADTLEISVGRDIELV